MNEEDSKKANIVLINYNKKDDVESQDPTIGSNEFIDFSTHNDYLCCSIYNLILGLFFLGIPAIIFSLKARKQFQEGKFLEAEKNATKSKHLNVVGIIIGTLVIIALVVFTILIVFIKIKIR